MQKINFDDYPIEDTPINADNLNLLQNNVENGIAESNVFKNMLYMNYSRGTSTTINGVTFTINDDGSISASGTGTNLGYLWLIYDNNSLKLDDDKTYTWSLTTVSGTFVDVARIVSKGISSNLFDVTTSVPTRTFKGSYFQNAINCFLRVQPNTVYNYTIKLQLEESSSATDYAPFAGYIVESGVAASGSGSYIKYSDGTMICSGKKELSSVAITNSINNGAFFASEVLTSFADFPVTFIDKPTSFSMSVSSIAGYGAWIQKMYPPTATNINNFKIIGTWSSTQNFEVSYIAIGRWK